MIKADGSAKVKERLRLNSLRQFVALLHFAGVAAIVLTPTSSAQVSERDVQKMEEQEYGIESPQQAKPPETPQSEPKGPSKPLDDHQTGAMPEKIKEIEAEEFGVKAIRKSTSERVWLFEDLTENRPRPGKVLLLKEGSQDVAAIRVLKNYPSRFAAKIVLRFKAPAQDAEYRALKKLGDKIVALIKEREADAKDLNEAMTDEDLAKEVAPDDNELDRGIPSPQPKSTPKGKAGEQKQSPSNTPEKLFTKDGDELTMEDVEVIEEDEPYAELDINEDVATEPKNHAIAAQYTSLRGVDKDDNPASYSGYGLRYAYNAWRKLLFKKRGLQDMLSLEIGLFNYTVNGFMKTDDRVIVYPFELTARYNALLGETFSAHGYFGLIKNFVSVGEDGDSASQILSTTKAAIGLGVMMKIGPSWAVRADYGTDLFGIGAVLKF